MGAACYIHTHSRCRRATQQAVSTLFNALYLLLARRRMRSTYVSGNQLPLRIYCNHYLRVIAGLRAYSFVCGHLNPWLTHGSKRNYNIMYSPMFVGHFIRCVRLTSMRWDRWRPYLASRCSTYLHVCIHVSLACMSGMMLNANTGHWNEALHWNGNV